MLLHALTFHKVVPWKLLLRLNHRRLKNEKITDRSSFLICVIDVGKDIFSCNTNKKRACAALWGSSIVGNLIGLGRAPEYQLPVCVSTQVYTLLELFVESFDYCAPPRTYVCMHTCWGCMPQTYLQIFNTTACICYCQLIKIKHSIWTMQGGVGGREGRE